MSERLYHEIMCPTLTKCGPCNCAPVIVADGNQHPGGLRGDPGVPGTVTAPTRDQDSLHPSDSTGVPAGDPPGGALAALREFVAHERALRDRQNAGGQHVGYSPTISVSTLKTLERILALDSTPPGGAWQPIETAPERRKVLVTWVNALGKRRTALASYWPEGTLDMSDDVPDLYVNEEGQNLDAGWWEESEGNEEAMFRLVEKMDFWMPLPAAPHE